MANPFVWALIAVTHAGNISLSTGYPSESICKDAINIAKTGMTIAEEKAADEKAKREKAIADGKWRLEHPLRKPTDEDRKICSKAKDEFIITSGNSEKGIRCVIEDDDLVHEYPVNWVTTISGSVAVYNNSNTIGFAKCVLINPAEDAK